MQRLSHEPGSQKGYNDVCMDKDPQLKRLKNVTI